MLTDQQLKERQTGLGGTDAAPICGASKWKTSMDVYNEKVLGITKEFSPEATERMDWGNYLEPLVIKRIEKEIGELIQTPTCTFRSKENPFMIANIDGLIDKAVIEVKTTNNNFQKEWGESGSDDFPLLHKYQCAHYLHVLDKDLVYLAVLIGGNDFRLYKYIRNTILEKQIIKNEKDFWENNILKEIPPVVSEIPVIKEEGFIDADDEDDKLITELNVIDEEIKTLNDMSKEIKNKLIEKLGNYSEMHLRGEKAITYKDRLVSRFDTSKFKVSNPMLYNKYKKESNCKVFNIIRNRKGN